MTLHVYEALARQFLLETEAAVSHGLIDKYYAIAIRVAIELTLDSERAPDTIGAVPPAPSLGRDRRSLRAVEDTRILP